MKFETLTAYGNGGGISDVQVVSALGAFTTLLYLSRPGNIISFWYLSL